jgi:hypothetical protein
MKRRICLAWFGDFESPGSSPRGKGTASHEPSASHPDAAEALPKSKDPVPEPRRTTTLRKH